MTNFNFLKCTLKNYDVTDWSDQPGYVKLSDIQDGNAVCQVIHSDTDTVAVEFVLTDLRYICINHPAVRELDICSLSYRIKDYIATIHIKMPGNSAAAELKTCIQYMQMQLENGNSALVDSLKPIAGHYYYVDIKGGPNSSKLSSVEPLLRGHPDKRPPSLERPLDNLYLNIKCIDFYP